MRISKEYAYFKQKGASRR
jgi:hypothetical protein